MLWSRSASFTSTTRISLAIARNIRRRFSACASVRLVKWMPPSLVTPSTSARTSAPKWPSISSGVTSVSSTTSWRKPAAITGALAPMSRSRLATATG